MFELKLLSKDAVPAALEKAMRYRLLNEPGEAESICLDVLKADPDNQEALVTLLLALTDRFGRGYTVGALDDGFGLDAYEYLQEAMNRYEEAGKICPPGNADALLRWNACARMMMSNRLEPRPGDSAGLEID